MSLYLSSDPRRISARTLRTRAADFPYFRPTQIANCAGWWDASKSGTLFDATSGGSAVAADGAVARWEDLSGNANHLTQSVSNNRPLRRVANINSLDTVDFDGSNDALSLTTALDAAVYTAFCVAKKSTGTDNFVVFGQATAFFPYVIADTTGGTFATKFTSGSSGASAGNTTQQLNRTTAFLVSQDSGTPRYYIDGVQPLSMTTGTGTSGTQFTTVGYRQGGANLYAKANFCEVVFYSRALTDLERATVENYLRKKWGTP